MLHFSYGQKIEVVDSLTQESLNEVVIYNTTKTTYAQINRDGFFYLNNFKNSDTIIFSLLGYTDKTFLKEQIKDKSSILLTQKKDALDEVILSVSRSKSTIRSIAEKVSVVNVESIQNFSPKTGADLLEIAPGVRLQKSQGGGGSPVLRGFEANRILLVVDGVRMNNAIYRSGHLQNAITIDPQSIEKTEVIFGSSSVAYGSDALGGVIHYYTKKPTLSKKTKVNYLLSSQFNSGNNAFIEHIESTINSKKIGSYTSLSYSNFGDIVTGQNKNHGYKDWGNFLEYSKNTPEKYYETTSINPTPAVQKNTGYTQWDFLQKFLFPINKTGRLTVNFQTSTSSNIPRFDRLNERINGNLRFAEWYYGPQKRIFLSPKVEFPFETKWLKKMTLIGAYQNIEESRISRKFGSLTKEFLLENVEVFSLNGDFETYFQNKVFFYGFEVTHNNVVSNAYASDIVTENNTVVSLSGNTSLPTRYPSGGSNYSSLAFYSNLNWNIIPTMFLTTGLRYTAIQTKASWVEKALINANLSSVNTSNQAVNGTLGIAYNPSKKIKINYLFATGFRNPNIDDLGKIRENNGLLIVPNPTLKPEYTFNQDIGISYFYPKKYTLSIRGFLTTIHDYIRRAPYQILNDTTTEDTNTILFSGEELLTQANINSNKGEIWGGSLNGTLNINPYLSLTGEYTFTEAMKDVTYGPLPSILPYFGSISLTYKKEKLWSNISYIFNSNKNAIDYSWTGEDRLQETPIINTNGTDDTLKYSGTPAWGILNFNFNYTFKKSILLTCNIENIFDIHYKPFASGIFGTGRSINIGINFKK